MLRLKGETRNARYISLCTAKVTAVLSLGNKKNTCRVSTGKPEEKGLLGKLVSRWKDNIKTNHKAGWEGKHQFHLTHERDKGPAVVNTKLRVPYHAENMVC